MIEELRTLAEKATPGPWRTAKQRNCDIDIIGRPSWPCSRFGKKGEWDVAVVTELENPKEQRANAALIVALVNNLPAILTALTAASKLEVAKEALRKSQQGWENVVEMGILPPRHWETANNLSNDCLQALAALEAK
jgi:hypothetical protein